MEDQEYILREEAARILGISVQTVDRYRKAGRIKSVQYRPRSFHHYKKSDIIAFKNGE